MRSTRSPSWIERLLGTAPAEAPPHVFALDGETLRYGAFHPSPQGWVFDASHEESLPEELFGTGILGAPLRDVRPFWELLEAFTAALPAPVKQASLLLPDSWLRLAFTESSLLPRRAAARDDVLRFKLSRLVPFRVEELRISATEVRPFPGQEEPLRLILGFAIENLLTQLEEAFLGVGVEIGCVTNTTLALLACLDRVVAGDELAALVMVEREFFTVSYLLGGEPLLYRYKSFGETGAGDVEAGAIRRDFRLTKTFVDTQFPERRLAHAFLAAPPESETLWLDWLADELDVAPASLDFEYLNLARNQSELSHFATAPLLGAASIEVR